MFRPTVEQLEQREVCSVSPLSALIHTAVPTAPTGQASQLLAHVEQHNLDRLSPANQGSIVAVADFNGDAFNLSERHQRAHGVLSANAIDSYFCLPEVGDEVHRRHNAAGRTENVGHNETITVVGNVGNSNGIIAVLIGL